MSKDYKVQVTMTAEQAAIVMRACELMARIRIGQLDRVVEEIEDMSFAKLPREEPEHSQAFDQLIKDRDVANHYACLIKGLMFPEIGPYPGASYGVGHDKRGDIAWEVYTTIRHKVSWHEHPEGGWGVNFDKPHSWSNTPLPECVILEENKINEKS